MLISKGKRPIVTVTNTQAGSHQKTCVFGTLTYLPKGSPDYNAVEE
jgi:hypothetical protein